MGGTLAEAVKQQQNREFQAFVGEAVRIYKLGGKNWDGLLLAWHSAVQASAYLEDRDRVLLFDLENQMFN